MAGCWAFLRLTTIPDNPTWITWITWVSSNLGTPLDMPPKRVFVPFGGGRRGHDAGYTLPVFPRSTCCTREAFCHQRGTFRVPELGRYTRYKCLPGLEVRRHQTVPGAHDLGFQSPLRIVLKGVG